VGRGSTLKVRPGAVNEAGGEFKGECPVLERPVVLIRREAKEVARKRDRVDGEAGLHDTSLSTHGAHCSRDPRELVSNGWEGCRVGRVRIRGPEPRRLWSKRAVALDWEAHAYFKARRVSDDGGAVANRSVVDDHHIRTVRRHEEVACVKVSVHA